MIAHRGVHLTGARENTLAAFELAAELGADMVELDVRRSGAGELAILHDEALDGIELGSCSLGEFEARTGFRPPLLVDVLSWADGRIALDVELKEDGHVGQAAELLMRFGIGSSQSIVTSFLDPVLAQLARLAPALRRGLLLEDSAERAVERAGACEARVLLPEMALLDEELIAGTAAAGLELIVWDFIAARHPGVLDDPRIAGVITDDVAGALAGRRHGR